MVVELKASFDEATNIRWARSLEDAGVQVFHGVVGLKTHAKLALVIRNDPDGKIRRYAHLGTGNYNPSTARYYTDLSLLTHDEAITSAVHNTFNYLTAYAEQPNYKPLMLAPVDMARSCIALIDREARNARRGKPARIIVKVNAVVDPPLIQALYRASRAGVEIDLIVRGQCALVPGLRGLSNRIRVRSIVGRFLEHSRVFYFENSGKPDVYLGSADWMPRNLYERVEVLFPVKDSAIRERVVTEILGVYLSDNCKSRSLRSNGTYLRLRTSRANLSINAQDHLLRVAGTADGAHRVHAARVPEDIETTPGMTAADHPQQESGEEGTTSDV